MRALLRTLRLYLTPLLLVLVALAILALPLVPFLVAGWK